MSHRGVATWVGLLDETLLAFESDESLKTNVEENLEVKLALF